MESTPIPVACFAPALSDEILDSYTQLIKDSADRLSPEQKAAINRCLDCVKAWWVLPESTLKSQMSLGVTVRGVSKSASVVPLSDELIEALWDVTPFPKECDYLSLALATLPHGTRSLGLQPVKWADGITRLVEQTEVVSPADKALRDAAFHLLWYTHEIARDREPLSQDKLA